jgi:hypothetical protein
MMMEDVIKAVPSFLLSKFSVSRDVCGKQCMNVGFFVEGMAQ